LAEEEVLVEYLTFFATVPPQMRRKAVMAVRNILQNPGVRVVPTDKTMVRSFRACAPAACLRSD
jgi:hypothetical protein